MLRLSVVIPAYNAEDRIGKCIKSVLNQDIPKNQYEVIIVNDGSQDSTESIIQGYISQSGNVKCVNQNNAGVSVARNTGLNRARGKYILFCDSDDYLDENVFGNILSVIEGNGLDGCCFNLRCISPSGVRIHDTFGFEQSTIMDGISFFNQGYVRGFSFVWLLSKEILEKNKIAFTEGVFIGEDLEFLIKFVSVAQKVMYKNFVYYNYIFSNNSLSHSYRRFRNLDHPFKLIHDIVIFKNNIKQDKKFVDFIDERIACYFQDAVNFVTWPTLLKFFPQVRKKIKDHPLYPYNTRNFVSGRKSELQLLNHSITIYFIYATIMNNWRILCAKLTVIYRIRKQKIINSHLYTID